MFNTNTIIKIGGICLMSMIIFVSQTAADIIKLKRGVSFEGKIIEEKDDFYVVSMEIGVVSFKKNDVADVVWYTQVDNAKMENDWQPEDETLNSGESLNSSEPMDTMGEGEDSDTKEDKVRYQGRYVTPEVFEIVQKEKDIKERRYRFLKEKERQEQEKKNSEIREKEIKTQDAYADKNDTSAVDTQNAKDGQLAETNSFGSTKAKPLGDNVTTGAAAAQKTDEYKAFTGKKYQLYKGDSI